MIETAAKFNLRALNFKISWGHATRPHSFSMLHMHVYTDRVMVFSCIQYSTSVLVAMSGSATVTGDMHSLLAELQE